MAGHIKIEIDLLLDGFVLGLDEVINALGDVIEVGVYEFFSLAPGHVAKDVALPDSDYRHAQRHYKNRPDTQ